MRTLGLIGGTSWHSTVEYYQKINRMVNDHFGDNTNPPLIVFNINQSEVHQYQVSGRWDKIADLFINAGQRLKAAGAEGIMFCANTPHKVFDLVEQNLDVPILHIADATAQAIQSKGVRKVAFLGTKFSMRESFITGRVSANNIEVLVPTQDGVIDELHRIIQKELTYGEIKMSSKEFILNAIRSMVNLGAAGVILGCTEFPLIIEQSDLDVPVFNTTEIHAVRGMEFVLSSPDQQ